MMKEKKTIGFIGGGNMAEAIIKGILHAGLYQASHIYVADIQKDRTDFLRREYGIETFNNNKQVAGKSDILILSIKPQTMQVVLNDIKDSIPADVCVISIAAGIRIEKILNTIGNIPVIRVMPNTPALVGEGMSALFSSNADKDSMDEAIRIFSAVGKAVTVDNEDLIDAVTAVSGSGPAYFFLLMEKMIETAKALGLEERSCFELVLQTAKGAAILASQSPDSPAQLRKKVTSPGGTTEAAIKVFEKSKFTDIVQKALCAANERSKELSR